VLENVVEGPVQVLKRPRAEVLAKARALLDRVGLAAKCDAFPIELSGGQQQRVAIARAIVTDPRLILADEPTGNLDSAASGEVLEIFTRLNDEGRTIVMITHEQSVADTARRVLRLSDGRVVDDFVHDAAQPAAAMAQGAPA
jgi:polar amino acid transport system ATP-binding protein